MQQPGMASNLEPMGAPTSFTARRSAASNLPNFELPPPPQLPNKFPSLMAINATQPHSGNVSVGNLLTPPSNIPGESLSPVSSGANSSSNNTAANNGLPPYTPTGFWLPPATGTTPYGFGNNATTPSNWGQGSFNPLFPPRGIHGMFSPSLGSLMRNNSNSPTAAEGVPPPPSYDVNQLPPFPSSVSMSAPASLPALVAQQQQQQQQVMANAYMSSQTPVSATTSHSSPVNPSDSYMQRPPPTPTYYSGSQPSSTPQQNQFPNFTAPSPVQQSPLSAGLSGSRVSPISGGANSLTNPSSQPLHNFTRPYSSYSLPAMSGPIMSNVHSPGAQMSLMGGLPNGMVPGFNSGHAAQMQQMYGNNHPQQVHNDRPFKCDQCPQSFNRNHDLKRHKRIHLAVKPFPCGHCEKSFSRKDALKRHILVKGCGKVLSGDSNKGGSMSDNDKDDLVSSDNDDSPVREAQD
ncbi:hypothetical protein MMC09_001884 [Bachmanniomyces sp. S44760]|nr:hypothetical protein [Bachmanniomyces sp. S44760]